MKQKIRETYTLRPHECNRGAIDKIIAQKQRDMGNVSASKAIEAIIKEHSKQKTQ